MELDPRFDATIIPMCLRWRRIPRYELSVGTVDFPTKIRARFPASITGESRYKKHDDARCADVWNKGGNCSRHLGITKGQRSAKWQPIPTADPPDVLSATGSSFSHGRLISGRGI